MGSPVQPADHPGAEPDSLPTAPYSSSIGCEVEGVTPELKVEPFPDAEAITSLAARPENSSTLIMYAPDMGKFTVIDAPAESARTFVAEITIVRDRPSPSAWSMST